MEQTQKGEAKYNIDCMKIFIIRNNQWFGPYSENVLLSYVNQGKILVHDKAIKEGDSQEQTVGFYLKQAGLKSKVTSKGNILSQLKAIGSELIYPKEMLHLRDFIHDKRFLILVIAGLLPMIIMNMPFRGYLLFYEVSLYFSVIWGMFFYTCFKTQQVSLKKTVLVYFLTQILVFVLWDSFAIPRINPFYAFVDKPFPINIVGFVFGVGLSEEFVKLLPLLFILKKAKESLIPQTVVFYGLISGIAFGVHEGAYYQMTINEELASDVLFLLSIVRFTSVPFLHALWCGIAGYFLAFAHLYPRYRMGLYTLAISLPTIIHGLYDSLSGSLFALFIVFIGLMLLIVYLRMGGNFQSKLRQ